MPDTVDDLAAAVALLERCKPLILVEVDDGDDWLDDDGNHGPWTIPNLWAVSLAIGLPGELVGLTDESRRLMAALWSEISGEAVGTVDDVIQGCRYLVASPDMRAVLMMRAEARRQEL